MHKLLISSCLLLAACGQQLPAWNAGKLVIIVPEAMQGAKEEFERELAQLFAGKLNATLEIIMMPEDQILTALHEQQAHLAAVSLRSGSIANAQFFSPSYQTVRELVVCNRDRSPPKKLADLYKRKLVVVAGSAQEDALREAQNKSPWLEWQTREGYTSDELLEEVAEGTLDCAIASELQLADARNYYPNLIATLDIAPPSRLAWGFPGNADPELLNQAQIFLTRIQLDGTLNRLKERFYGHNNRLARMDAAAFITETRITLPHYRRMFEEAASSTGIDWRLLAALAYQESQWDPLATSYTNVRGMMMLTEDTADEMNVSNRLDARESIIAGAKYLAMLKEKMPARISEPDRTWLALAAYNQGYGHLEDARILTHRAGMNPDSWSDVKKWMPMLNQPGYYKTLIRGYARGGEAVILVENIRNYYDMLKRLQPDPAQAISDEISYRLIEPLQRLLR
ncbi:MAG: membrane-bound lytic murein transglycosylase MltF [Gallionella sp.]|nr:membrane-bound lytic murein transglycosylase MltF [Gallionella sp.]